jgi:hypothetical protein
LNPSIKATMLLTKPSKPPAVVMSQFAVPSLSKYTFQDAAKSIPAVVGGAVAKIVCPATGVEVTFTNVTLQQDEAGLKYLAANGTSSKGTTAAINLTGTNKLTVWAGLRVTADDSIRIFCELSASSASNVGSINIAAPGGAAANLIYSLNGGSATSFTATRSAAPVKLVTSCVFDTAGADRAAEIVPLINGATPSLTGNGAADSGTGNFGNHALNLLSRDNGASLFFAGRLYGFILRGAAASSGQITDTSAYLSRLTGV